MRYYEKLLDIIENKGNFNKMTYEDDQASHWLMKIVFSHLNKGDFVMYESQIFSAKLYKNSYDYAIKQLQNL